MRANLELTNGLVLLKRSRSPQRKMDRSSARTLVAEACRQARSERCPLREILSANSEVTAILSPQSLAQLFEPANYLGSAEAS
jgi:3-carboxy-cis,cis-muconate cycloisomerase